MIGAPMVQRCPHCGEQPMSRIRFLFVPGTRSTCRRCDRRIRVDISRTKMLLLVGLGVVMGAAIVALADTLVSLAIGIGLALLVAFALDQWAWNRLPWLSDEPAGAAAKPEPIEAAGREA